MSHRAMLRLGHAAIFYNSPSLPLSAFQSHSGLTASQLAAPASPWQTWVGDVIENFNERWAVRTRDEITRGKTDGKPRARVT